MPPRPSAYVLGIYQHFSLILKVPWASSLAQSYQLSNLWTISAPLFENQAQQRYLQGIYTRKKQTAPYTPRRGVRTVSTFFFAAPEVRTHREVREKEVTRSCDGFATHTWDTLLCNVLCFITMPSPFLDNYEPHH